MSIILLLLLLFAAFGAVCGVYLSVVGFVVTTVVVFGGLGLVNAETGGIMTPGFLGVAFVAEQVGFFLGVIALAMRESARRRQVADKPIETAIGVEHEQTH